MQARSNETCRHTNTDTSFYVLRFEVTSVMDTPVLTIVRYALRVMRSRDAGHAGPPRVVVSSARSVSTHRTPGCGTNS